MDERGAPARIPGLKDVATAAGVSFKTVSNVVNGSGRVGEATRARVEAVIAELGYRPNVAGRQLRQGRTNILALAVPGIRSPYFSALAHAVIEAARPHGYTVFIDETRGDPDAEREVARGFSVRLIDGIVFSPLGLTLAEADALRGAVPMVLLGEGGDVPLGTDHVSIDNVRAAEEATAHLIAAGRTRLAFLGAEDEAGVSTGALRVRGFRRAHEAAGLAVDERWLLPGGDYTRAEGDAAIRSVLARIGAVDGVVCANDELALGAAHALRTNGIRVPDDVAITGFDDTEDGRYANPSLTTVAPDVVGLAEYAVARVLAQLEGDAGAPRDEVVPHRLLVRESSARR